MRLFFVVIGIFGINVPFCRCASVAEFISDRAEYVVNMHSRDVDEVVRVLLFYAKKHVDIIKWIYLASTTETQVYQGSFCSLFLLLNVQLFAG